MEVHFQFDGREYVNTILKNYLGSKESRRSLISQSLIFIALVLLFALRIRYRNLRYALIIIGLVVVFFMKKINTARMKKAIYNIYDVKDDDVKVMHIKLDENFMTVGQVMEESKYSYEAVKEFYVIGECLYIRFINNTIAFVHARAFKDAESVKNFVECLEKKTNLKVYRKNDTMLR